MRDTTRSFAEMAMYALIRNESVKIGIPGNYYSLDPSRIARIAWNIATAMESEAMNRDKNRSIAETPEVVLDLFRNGDQK